MASAPEKAPVTRTLMRSADVSTERGRAAIAAEVRKLGRLDWLVDNAGTGGGTAGLDVDVERARRVLETNFYSHVALTEELWPLLRESPRARVIVVSSRERLPLPRAAAIVIPMQSHAAVKVPRQDDDGMLRATRRTRESAEIMIAVYQQRNTVGLRNTVTIAARDKQRGRRLPRIVRARI